MLYFKHALCLTYSMDGEGVEKNREYLFETKNKGKIKKK